METVSTESSLDSPIRLHKIVPLCVCLLNILVHLKMPSVSNTFTTQYHSILSNSTVFTQLLDQINHALVRGFFNKILLTPNFLNGTVHFTRFAH